MMDLCEGTERSLGEWVVMRWWEQDDINMTRAREAAATVTAAEAEENEVEE